MSVRAPIVASHCQAGDEFKPIHTFTLIRYINGVVALSGRVFLQKITSAQGLLFTRWNIRGGVGEAPKVKSHPQILNVPLCLCAFCASNKVLRLSARTDEYIAIAAHDGDLHTLFPGFPTRPARRFWHCGRHQ